MSRDFFRKLYLIAMSSLFFTCSSSEEEAEPTEAIEPVEETSTFGDETTDETTEPMMQDEAAMGAESAPVVQMEPVTVNFDFDRSEVKPGDQMKLDEVVSTLMSSPETTVQITGHTDSFGTEEYNDALSIRRASAVKDYLMMGGATSSQIITYGEGKKMPLIPDAKTSDEHAQNRRAVIETSSSGYSAPTDYGTTMSEPDVRGGSSTDMMEDTSSTSSSDSMGGMGGDETIEETTEEPIF